MGSGAVRPCPPEAKTLNFLPLALVALSAVLGFVMIRVGAMDHPGPRSSHDRPTPKGGGVGIVAAFLVGLVASGTGGTAPVAFAAGVLGLAVVSHFDDMFGWSFGPKLVAQIFAAFFVILPGYRLGLLHFPGMAVALGEGAAIALSAIWLLFVTNAVNFMDGLDGLVGGSGLIACLLAAGLAVPGSGVALTAICLAAGIAGFLPLNWPRARLFMGDVGSQPVGFVLAVLGIMLAGSPQSGSVLVMPLLLAPLLLDAAFTLLRRLAARERITSAHRGHLYQVAHRSGLSAPVVSAVYWGLTLWGGVCAWLTESLPGPIGWLGPVLCLASFVAWGLFVRRCAQRAAITRW